MPETKKQTKTRRAMSGYTLIELLVVISIITFLASIVLTSINIARRQAKVARAKADLRSIAEGVVLLASDTGKWPTGCPTGMDSHSQYYTWDLSPLVARPTVGSGHPQCPWQASDLNNWNGPYVDHLSGDPWRNGYWFFPSEQLGYYSEGGSMEVMSPGPDGSVYAPSPLSPVLDDNVRVKLPPY